MNCKNVVVGVWGQHVTCQWVTLHESLSLFPHRLLLGFRLFPWWEISTSRLEEPPAWSSHLHFVVLVEQELSRAAASLIVLLRRLNHGFSFYRRHWHPIGPWTMLEAVGWLRVLALGDFPGGLVVKNLPCNAGYRVQSLVGKLRTRRRAAKPVHHHRRVHAPQWKIPHDAAKIGHNQINKWINKTHWPSKVKNHNNMFVCLFGLSVLTLETEGCVQNLTVSLTSCVAWGKLLSLPEPGTMTPAPEGLCLKWLVWLPRSPSTLLLVSAPTSLPRIFWPVQSWVQDLYLLCICA